MRGLLLSFLPFGKQQQKCLFLLTNVKRSVIIWLSSAHCLKKLTNVNLKNNVHKKDPCVLLCIFICKFYDHFRICIQKWSMYNYNIKKLSKKAKRELDLKKRKPWGEINPVTRKSENPKAYNKRYKLKAQLKKDLLWY